jgi:hypothetical protein
MTDRPPPAKPLFTPASFAAMGRVWQEMTWGLSLGAVLGDALRNDRPALDSRLASMTPRQRARLRRAAHLVAQRAREINRQGGSG